MSRWIAQVPPGWPQNPLLYWQQIDAKSPRQASTSDSPPPGCTAGQTVILLLPATQTLLLAVQLPAGGRQQARATLPYLVEEHLSCDADKVHTALGPRLADGRHLAAVIDPAWLRSLLERFADWQLPVTMAIPEACLLPGDADTWCIDWHGREGCLSGASELPQTLDSGDAQTPPQMLHSLLSAARQAQRAPSRIVLYPRNAAAAIDSQRWSEALGLPVQTGSDNPFIDHQHPWHNQFNLLQGEFAPASPLSALRPKAKPVLVVLGLMLCLHLGASLVQWWQLKQEATQLRAAMEQTFRQTFPQARSVVDPALQMQRQIDSLSQQQGSPQAADFLVLLNQAAPRIKASGARIQRIDYQEQSLTLTFPNRSQAENLQAQLRQDGVEASLSAAQPNALRISPRANHESH